MVKHLSRLSSEAYLGAVASIIRDIPPAGGADRTVAALDLLDKRLAAMGLVIETIPDAKP